jgi:DNA-directed RNA polymerase subunit RPC12/RpoP
MRFACPQCDQKLQTDDAHAGRTVRCPKCNTKVVVPAAPDAAPAADGKTRQKIVIRSPGSAPAAAPGSDYLRPSAREHTDSTNVKVWLAFLIGLGIAIVVYLFLAINRKWYLSQLLMERGWVCYAETLLAGWATGILILKWRMLGQQKQAMLLNVLPTEISEDITTDNVDRFLGNIDSLPPHLHASFMVSRMRHGLAHFRVRRSNPEVASMMMAQSDMDAGAIHSSYALLKVLIWAIPILGFIGTVLGISGAVGGFSATLEKAQDIDALRQSLNGITGGLAVAFDTTLVALVMSLMISFPASTMQKAEEDLLTWVDEYCNENLLKRLNDSAAAGGAGSVNLADGGAVVAAVLDGQRNFGVALDTVATRFDALHERQSALAAEFTTAVNRFTRDAQGIRSEAADAIRETAAALQASFAPLGEGVAELNKLLAELGGRQVTVQKPVVHRHFSLFGPRKPE